LDSICRGKNGIDGRSREHVEQSCAILEPGVPPGLDHRGGLARIQAFRGENASKFLTQRLNAGPSARGDRERCAFQRLGDSVADAPGAPFEKDEGIDPASGTLFNRDPAFLSTVVDNGSWMLASPR